MRARHALFYILVILILVAAACSLAPATPTSPTQPFPQVSRITLTPLPPTLTNTPTATLTFTPLPSDTPAGSLTASQTPTRTATITRTPTNTPLPTKAVVRAEILERANCRYGPGAVYLYKYGLVPGSNMNVIGRIASSAWIYIQAIGGNNPCWVKASLVKVTGDLTAVEVVYPGKALLPVSPYYPPVSWVSATRSDATITVNWNDVPLRAGDEEDEFMQHYIVEVWRCEAGQLIFEPLATNLTWISFTDQYGCAEPSHGRVYVQEKHGFAGPVEIPWP